MNLNRTSKVFLSLIIILILFLTYCHLESRWLKTREFDVQMQDIPESFKGKTIVFISDIHHGPYFSIKRVNKLVKRINALNPDIIILGGDYVHHKSCYIVPVFNELKHLNANIGIYAVLGNHDHWEDANATRKIMQENNIHICDNHSYWLRINNDSIKIGGVGDLWEDKQEIEKTIYDVKPQDFCILISHNPDYVEQMHTNLVDITLAGHTHGGQMTMFGLFAPLLPSKYGQKYRYGWVIQDNNTTYITSGVGSIFPPLRFFCRPEIVVFKLN